MNLINVWFRGVTEHSLGMRSIVGACQVLSTIWMPSFIEDFGYILRGKRLKI